MNKEIATGLAWGAAMIALALAGTWAQRLGWIDHDMVTRLVTGVIGLWLAWYGNRMPKAFVPNACARQVRRVGGWAMAVSGLAYAGLWAFAPIPVAVRLGSAVVLAGIGMTIGYALWLNRRKAAESRKFT